MQKNNPQKEIRKPQKQQLPGSEMDMDPQPIFDNEKIKGSGKLQDKVALITGGDSGIGRAVAVLFAKEGADIAIIYLSESKDAEVTSENVKKYGRQCLAIEADISNEKACINSVKEVIKKFGKIDVLVNNAGVQFEQHDFMDITSEQLLKTFQTNIFAMFWITKAVLPSMAKGSAIINSTSVTAYRGSSSLIDYSTTKGAILSFTRSLSANLIEKGIRVNAVAPGPIWTPLIVATFEEEKVTKHGSDTPMKRSGEPVEVAPSYLFLASNDESSYITGQVLHPNGGEIING
jgi:NAD(P)-dependent dehydrogenase (short-subunit alcohol dehydrogenase family)